MTPAVELREVTKVFTVRPHGPTGFKALVLKPASLWKRDAWGEFVAVDRLSFAVEQGETFGVLGRNGAGKSTLLGLIGGILRPNSGTVMVRGRVCPLLELGVGFTPELTGRENVIINGVLLGLRRRQVEEKVEQIIEFCGLHQFIDQPLKTFSSGMQVRLGFSIAVHAGPDILLVDEVLAVGDAEFQAKCLERIGELRGRGVTIVFVSHDLPTLEAICDRAVWIDHGRLRALGKAKDVVEAYRTEVLGQHGHSPLPHPLSR
jgi:lipopolysaccharide transport system ATP-binding protein